MANYVRDAIAAGKPIVFWKNRFSPFTIGRETVAHNGKVAIVRTETSGNIGKPMILEYRMARKAHLNAWALLVESDPFNTTEIVSYFDEPYQVIFRVKDPIIQMNEVIQQYDFGQDIFDSTHGDYRKGFNLFRGFLNLIITGPNS